MATVDSSTTDAELKGLYLDYCGYVESGSASDARAFATVCRALLFRGIRSIDVNGAQVELDPNALMNLVKQAEAFAVANDTSASAARYRHLDFKSFRS